MSSKLDGPGIAAISVGIIFVYAGIKGYSPLTAIANIIKGKHPNEGQSAASLTNPGISDEFGGGTFPAGGSAAENQKIAKGIAKGYGWDTGAEWAALVSLWQSESNWSNTIWNTSASCGGDAYAYGIVQACGHGVHKAIPGHGSVCPYPAGNAGNPPECGGSSNAGSQIKWGLDYIKRTYGRPTNVPHGGY
jgi:hypothetical protein